MNVPVDIDRVRAHRFLCRGDGVHRGVALHCVELRDFFCFVLLENRSLRLTKKYLCMLSQIENRNFYNESFYHFLNKIVADSSSSAIITKARVEQYLNISKLYSSSLGAFHPDRKHAKWCAKVNAAATTTTATATAHKAIRKNAAKIMRLVALEDDDGKKKKTAEDLLPTHHLINAFLHLFFSRTSFLKKHSVFDYRKSYFHLFYLSLQLHELCVDDVGHGMLHIANQIMITKKHYYMLCVAIANIIVSVLDEGAVVILPKEFFYDSQSSAFRSFDHTKIAIVVAP